MGGVKDELSGLRNYMTVMGGGVITGIGTCNDFATLVKLAYEAKAIADRWIDTYNVAYESEFYRLWEDWKYVRLGISLQARLLVEQIFTDRGKPWSGLVSGFNTLGEPKYKT